MTPRLRRQAYWIVTAAMLGIYLTMLVWTLPGISREAGGLAPFDMRPGGYSFAEAKAFLAALTPAGKALYLGPQRWLDLAYPLLLAVFTGWSILKLTPQRLKPWGRALALLALPGMVFDYLENGAVASLLRAGPGALSVQAVEHASRMSVLKAVFTSISLGLLLLLFVFWLWRRWRPAERRQT